MKKIFSILLFISIVYSSDIQRTNALFGVGDIVFDPSSWAQSLIDYAIQGSQYASELVTQYGTTATSINTNLTMVNDTILRPLRDALTIAAIVTTGNNMQNLILGGMGNERLLITNPDQYLKNKANLSININLSNIAYQNSVYSNSILNSMISSVRSTSNINNTLASLSQSSIPSTVQRNLCTDAMLNKTAQDDVRKADGTYDQTDFTARKKVLYDTLCVGDPRTDPALAKRLMAVNQQKPSIGGWDTWLATTGGDNQYTRSVTASEAILKEAEAKRAAAQRDLTSGGGIKSQTRCDQRSSLDINGNPVTSATNPSIIPCVNEAITKTSASLNALWNDTLGSPLKTLQNSLNGSASIVGTAFNTIGLLAGIDQAFNTTANNLSGGNTSHTTNSAPVSYSTTVSTQSNTTVTSSSTYTQDLIQNPSIKTTITDPIKKLLSTDLAAISTLGTLDQNYLAEINLYEGQLSTLNNCYDGLVRDFSIPKDANFVSFYTNKKSSTDALLSQITNELNSLPVATRLINETLTKINASNSTQEITALFNNYQNQSDSGAIPNAMSRATREGDYQRYKTTVEQDMGTNGSITSYTSQCSTIRSQQQSYNNYSGGL